MTDGALQWHDPDWLDEAATWIRIETARSDIAITGPIEQPHVYPWSTVLRVPTADGPLFFKATAPETIYEAALTQKLAGWYPDRMPELVAVDTPRGWMLMRDGGEPLRTAIRAKQDLAPWVPVTTLYAELQLGVVQYVQVFLALGVPDWRLAALPALYAGLLADTDHLRIGQPDGLSAEEYALAQSLAARFADICRQLAAVGIPETINHGDFHDGNVLVRSNHITLFDWGDANITHPFVTLRTFFVSMENSLKLEDYEFTPQMHDLLHLYLAAWKLYASEADLMAAFQLSRPVASIVKALAWHQTVSRLPEYLRGKYAGIVPELFREFMEYEKMLRG